MNKVQIKTDGFFTMREERREREQKIESRGVGVVAFRRGEKRRKQPLLILRQLPPEANRRCATGY